LASPSANWIDANEALAQGRRVPFFLVKDYQKQLELISSESALKALSINDVVGSLKETPNYVPEPVEPRLPEEPQVKRQRVEVQLSLVDDDEVDGITHRIQHWSLGDDKVPFYRVDEIKAWKSTREGRLRQVDLLKQFKEDAKLPSHRFNIHSGDKSVFLPLLNSTSHVSASVLQSWRTLAVDVETKATQVLRGVGLLPEDFVKWSDIIKNFGGGAGELSSDFVGEGFSALRPEAFVKTGLCVTLEHHEHLGSTSINVFPPQGLLSAASDAGPQPPRARNLWRGWILADIEAALKSAGFVPEEEEPFTRAHFHNFYVDNWSGRDLEFSKFLIEELKVPTFFVVQEEGDLVMTTHHGSHDVVYTGGPSYQVSWNFGFSKKEGLALLKAFQYPEALDDCGNDASTTPNVLRNLLNFCWPGPTEFKALQPAFAKVVAKVIRFNVFYIQ
jgi:hypothetical protein